ncbi:hypothetical protein V7128_06310 [Neobacillus vireti]|uniref:hypothetical protein n=1 Tax=Neobacillus vireti TaxID=220686 RepID=UPI002FFF3AA6
MKRKIRLIGTFVIGLVCLGYLSGCNLLYSNELIVNRYADALLTKNNELQFRFRINNEILDGHQLYKVKVTIHDDKLARAVGKREIIYGEEQVQNGDFLETKGHGEKYIFMDPLPLKEDLHIQELRTMIERDQAVSIEVFNDKEVLGRAYLTNFSSEL